MISVEDQMTDILDDLYVETKRVNESAIKAEAKATASELRRTSPKQKGGLRSGRYARGWRWKDEGYGSAYVYNATDWQLTHLLEDGHRVFNRFGGPYGSVGGDGHITNAENHAAERLPVRISRGLK